MDEISEGYAGPESYFAVVNQPLLPPAFFVTSTKLPVYVYRNWLSIIHNWLSDTVINEGD